jgi:hypothetical protein
MTLLHIIVAVAHKWALSHPYLMSILKRLILKLPRVLKRKVKHMDYKRYGYIGYKRK